MEQKLKRTFTPYRSGNWYSSRFWSRKIVRSCRSNARPAQIFAWILAGVICFIISLIAAELAFKKMVGEVAGNIFVAYLILSFLAVMNGLFIMSSRLAYAFSEDKIFPRKLC